MKSVSAKKLKPIHSKVDLKDKKKQKMTQSLVFNQGLTFVMRKGKVVPTEKYVSSYMMPYTSMEYQSVQLKSDANRKAIMLQEMEPVQKSNKIPTSIKNKNHKNKKAQSNSQSKTKQKAKKADGQKKNVILEEESDAGISDIEVKSKQPISKTEIEPTWNEIMDENRDLKMQIQN